MRALLKFCLIALLVFGLGGGDALAKKKKKKDKDDEGILLTGIAAFDDVFTRVGEIDTRLTSAEKGLKSGQRDLNTSLELKKGAPFTDAIAELKKRADNKLELTISSQNVPKLKTSDAVPTNVQTSVDAFNSLTDNVTTSITDVTSVVGEIDGLVKATKDMPSKLKDEFKKESNFLDMIFALPKTSKALTRDIGITTALPGRATAVTNEMTSLLDIVRTEFVPVGGPNRQPEGREDPATPDPEPTTPGTKREKPSGIPRAEQPKRR